MGLLLMANAHSFSDILFIFIDFIVIPSMASCAVGGTVALALALLERAAANASIIDWAALVLSFLIFGKDGRTAPSENPRPWPLFAPVAGVDAECMACVRCQTGN